MAPISSSTDVWSRHDHATFFFFCIASGRPALARSGCCRRKLCHPVMRIDPTLGSICLGNKIEGTSFFFLADDKPARRKAAHECWCQSVAQFMIAAIVGPSRASASIATDAGVLGVWGSLVIVTGLDLRRKHQACSLPGRMSGFAAFGLVLGLVMDP